MVATSRVQVQRERRTEELRTVLGGVLLFVEYAHQSAEPKHPCQALEKGSGLPVMKESSVKPKHVKLMLEYVVSDRQVVDRSRGHDIQEFS